MIFSPCIFLVYILLYKETEISWKMKPKIKNRNKVLSRKDKKLKLLIEDCVRKAKLSRKNKDHSKFYENYLKPQDEKRTFKAFRSLFEEEINIAKKFVAPRKSLLEDERKLEFLPDEIRIREKKAIEIAKNKAKSVAPICNKGAYQPISLSDLKTIGRKI